MQCKSLFTLLKKIYEVDESEIIETAWENYLKYLLLMNYWQHLLGSSHLGSGCVVTWRRSLIHNPRILFLDEPTIGLDAVAKDSVRSFLREINSHFDTTIILTTHDLKEELKSYVSEL